MLQFHVDAIIPNNACNYDAVSNNLLHGDHLTKTATEAMQARIPFICPTICCATGPSSLMTNRAQTLRTVATTIVMKTALNVPQSSMALNAPKPSDTAAQVD